MICIIMGVAGSGKSTIGTMLSQRLKWEFYDGDDFHPPENLKKMSQGIPLNDGDRLPWLLEIKNLIDEAIASKSNIIIACSALKAVYREFLQQDSSEIYWIYLKGEYSQIWERIQQRQEHFMKAEMLRSQWETLEEPQTALTISIAETPEAILNKVLEYLKNCQKETLCQNQFFPKTY